MYPYYSHLGFTPMKHNNKDNEINNEYIFCLYEFVKHNIHVNKLEGVYDVYNVNILSFKDEVVTPFHYSMILVDCCEKYKYVMDFTSNYIVAKFEDYADNKLNML